VSMNAKSDAVRRRILKPVQFWLYLWAKLPLAACAGLGLQGLDDTTCVVTLPGGWRTQNPFRSTYFAAQLMAAEMSTGAAAMVLVEGAPASVAMLLREVRAVYTKRIQGPSRYVFSDVAGMQQVVDRAAASGESESYTARSIGHGPDGEPASEFELTWSFKRRR
jgi:hypothetical protein